MRVIPKLRIGSRPLTPAPLRDAETGCMVADTLSEAAQPPAFPPYAREPAPQRQPGASRPTAARRFARQQLQRQAQSALAINLVADDRPAL